MVYEPRCSDSQGVEDLEQDVGREASVYRKGRPRKIAGRRFDADHLGGAALPVTFEAPQ